MRRLCAECRSEVMSSSADFFAELGIQVPDVGQENVMVACFANPTAHVREDRNRSLSVHLPTGKWNCHGCGVAGNAYSAARMMGLDQRDAANLAKRHGLFKDDKSRMPTERQLKAWKLELLGNEKLLWRLYDLKGWTREAMWRCGLGWNGKRLTFAYRQYKPGYGTHLKVVGWGGYLPGGNPKCVAKGQRTLFPTPHGDVDRPMFVVEGEPAAISVRSCGHQAIAIPGSGGWRYEYVPSLVRFKRLVVVPDCDGPGRKLAEQIKECLPHATVADLDGEREDGWDIGDEIAQAASRFDGPWLHRFVGSLV